MEELLSNLVMRHGIFFPDNPAQIGTTIIEVCLREDLQAAMRRRVDIMQCLWGEKDKLVWRDPHHIPVLAKHIFDRPWVTA